MENLYAQLMSDDVYERDKRQVAKYNALKAALVKYDKENASLQFWITFLPINDQKIL